MSIAERRGQLGAVGHLGVDQLMTTQITKHDDAARPLHQARRFLLKRHQVAASHSRGFGQTFNDCSQVGDFAFDHQ